MSEGVGFDFSGKCALVTGAAGGIGKASALALARAGADVAIVDVKDEEGEATAAEIVAMGRRSFYQNCDVTDVDAVAEMVARVIDTFGALDLAHNNAGISGRPYDLLDDRAVAEWRRVIDTDLSSVFYCCREEARHMIPRGQGRIVNTASISGAVVNNMEFEGSPAHSTGLMAYCSAKAGVRQLTRALSISLMQHNIFVNSISPGYIDTPMTAIVQETPRLLDHENLTTPIHRQGQPDEMVGGILYLLSEGASFTTGHDLVMDGGYTVW